MGHVDRALINSFDMSVFMAGIKGKKGSPPKITSRGNLVAQHGPTGPEIHINMNRYGIAGAKDANLGGFGKSSRNISAEFKFVESQPVITASFTIGDDPKMVRAIYKIAFGAVAFHFGVDAALDSYYDDVRCFVLDGIGDKKILAKPANDTEYRNAVSAPIRRDGDGQGLGFLIRIANVEFFVDLTRDGSMLNALRAELEKEFGRNGWGIFPISLSMG